MWGRSAWTRKETRRRCLSVVMRCSTRYRNCHLDSSKLGILVLLRRAPFVCWKATCARSMRPPPQWSLPVAKSPTQKFLILGSIEDWFKSCMVAQPSPVINSRNHSFPLMLILGMACRRRSPETRSPETGGSTTSMALSPPSMWVLCISFSMTAINSSGVIPKSCSSNSLSEETAAETAAVSSRTGSRKENKSWAVGGSGGRGGGGGVSNVMLRFVPFLLGMDCQISKVIFLAAWLAVEPFWLLASATWTFNN